MNTWGRHMSAGSNPASVPGPLTTVIDPHLLSGTDGTSQHPWVSFSTQHPQPQPPAIQLTLASQLFSPATVKSTRKCNRTSLPQGTARERELLRLSKLSDGDSGIIVALTTFDF